MLHLCSERIYFFIQNGYGEPISARIRIDDITTLLNEATQIRLDEEKLVDSTFENPEWFKLVITEETKVSMFYSRKTTNESINIYLCSKDNIGNNIMRAWITYSATGSTDLFSLQPGTYYLRVSGSAKTAIVLETFKETLEVNAPVQVSFGSEKSHRSFKIELTEEALYVIKLTTNSSYEASVVFYMMLTVRRLFIFTQAIYRLRFF